MTPHVPKEALTISLGRSESSGFPTLFKDSNRYVRKLFAKFIKSISGAQSCWTGADDDDVMFAVIVSS